MRALFIYNPHSQKERELRDGTVEMLRNIMDEVEAVDFNEVRNLFRIRETPALILIRDDLQGGSLLDETGGQLRLVGEVYKSLEEEENNFHNLKTHRIDNIINSVAASKAAEITEQLVQENEKVRKQLESTAEAVDFILMNFAPEG